MKNYQGHDLLSTLFDDCKRYNTVSDEIAFACALHVIATVCQRRFSYKGRSTSLFHMFVMPPGSGKEGYRRWIEVYLRAVSPKLVGPRYRSDQALKVGLSEVPSQCLIVDEAADSLIAAYDPRRRDAMAQDLVTVQNELFNGLEILAGSRTRSSEIPEVVRPRLSMVGFTTQGQFQTLMRFPEYLGNGAFSRNLIFISDNADYQLWDDDRETPRADPAIVERLLMLAQGPDGRPGFEPDSEAVTELTMDTGARHALHAYALACQLDVEMVEREHRGMYRRIREGTARKMMMIRALACGRTAIMRPDVQFGVQEGDAAWVRASAAIGDAGISEACEMQREILACIRAKAAKASDGAVLISVLHNQRRWRKTPADVFANAVHALTRVGQVAYADAGKRRVAPCAGDLNLTPESFGDHAESESVH